MTRLKPQNHRAVMAARVTPAAGSDFAPTAPWAGRALLEILLRIDPSVAAGEADCLEPACGAGHLVHALRDGFPVVLARDLYNYGWGHAVADFLGPVSEGGGPPSAADGFDADWVISNPPFGDKVEPFVRRAWSRARRGVAMLLQTRALEGKERHALFESVPLYAVCPFSARLSLRMNAWQAGLSGATSYSWFLFVKPPVLADGAPPPAFGGHRIPIAPDAQARLSRLSDVRFALRGEDGRVSLRDVQACRGLPPGLAIGEAEAACLVALDRQGEGGTCALSFAPMTGGRLAYLVQCGLAERMAEDAIGGCRYRVSAMGRRLVVDARWRTACAGPPRGRS